MLSDYSSGPPCLPFAPVLTYAFGAAGGRNTYTGVSHGERNRRPQTRTRLEVLRRDQPDPARVEERDGHREVPGRHREDAGPRGFAGRGRQRAGAQTGVGGPGWRGQRVPAGAHGHGLREEQGHRSRLPEGPNQARAQGQLHDGQRNHARRRQRHRRGHLPRHHGGQDAEARAARVPLHGGRGDRADRGEQPPAGIPQEQDPHEPGFGRRGRALRGLFGRPRQRGRLGGGVGRRARGRRGAARHRQGAEGRALGPRDPHRPRQRAEDHHPRPARSRRARRARREDRRRQQAERHPARVRSDRVAPEGQGR